MYVYINIYLLSVLFLWRTLIDTISKFEQLSWSQFVSAALCLRPIGFHYSKEESGDESFLMTWVLFGKAYIPLNFPRDPYQRTLHLHILIWERKNNGLSDRVFLSPIRRQCPRIPRGYLIFLWRLTGNLFYLHYMYTAFYCVSNCFHRHYLESLT